MLVLFFLGILVASWLHWSPVAGGSFVLGCAAAAWWTKPRDLLTVVVSPPLLFFCALLGVKALTSTGDTLISIAEGTALTLADVASGTCARTCGGTCRRNGPGRPEAPASTGMPGPAPGPGRAASALTTVKIILRAGASSWRRAASAAVARPSGEANAARSSSMVSHSSSAIR
jgi:hypothetical protein